MTYQVEFTNKAFKQLEKLSKDIQQRIKTKIYELAENPRPSGVIKLENRRNTVFALVIIEYYIKLKMIY